MRRCVSAAVFAILLLTGRAAFAGSIAIGDTLQVLNPGGAIYGGVFQVHDVNLDDPLDPTDQSQRIDLLTFCLQHEQDISIDDFIVHDISLVTDDGEDLDKKSAWIYSQYSQAALSTYTEDEIQAAIWVIQQQVSFTRDIFPSPALTQQNRDNANALIAAAQQAVDGGYLGTDVRVLTLLYLTGGAEHSADDPAQDLLVYTGGGNTTQDVHMPEPATLVLVGSGVVGLIRRHSKRRRTS
jgi:hypothetical protein